ncbi:MAG TPA: S8 family peptidase [Vicinamibacterales bacterium]|nr:S8 family peptidase [Vicinamibacterales bacterium]
MAIVNGRPLEQDPRTPAVVERVVVKLRPEAAAQPGAAPLGSAAANVWSAIRQRYPGVAIRPYFSASTGHDAARMSAAPPPGGAGLDPARYVAVDVPADVEAEAVAGELRRAPEVETAYREGGPTPPPVSPDDDPRSANQGYLGPAPEGVDAQFAWTIAQVDGSGVGFVDLERGWTLDHEDLAGAKVDVISGINLDYRGHGTAVLGEVAATDNAIGCIGIAPASTVRVVSQWRTPSTYSTAEAILSAADGMAPGDVLLLEAQTTFATSGGSYVPVEVEALVFDAIRSTVDRGIVVIEAAANGSFDLDRFEDASGRQALKRGSADFRDSGAIVVGAASSRHPHRRLGFSNFGSRVDCFAWGEHIDTCGDGGIGDAANVYTPAFGGTSGASPIVAACALLLQSLRARDGLPMFTPAEMRALLADTVLNTRSEEPAADRIGVMPDLRALIEHLHRRSTDACLSSRAASG